MTCHVIAHPFVRGLCVADIEWNDLGEALRELWWFYGVKYVAEHLLVHDLRFEGAFGEGLYSE